MRRLRGAVSSASGAVMRHHVVLTAVAAARVPHAVLPVAALPLRHHLATLGAGVRGGPAPRQLPRPRPGQCVGRDGDGLEVQLWHVRVYVQNEGQGKRRLSRVSSTIQSPRPALAHDLGSTAIVTFNLIYLLLPASHLSIYFWRLSLQRAFILAMSQCPMFLILSPMWWNVLITSSRP